MVYWLHGRNNTESSDQYPAHFLAEGVANRTLPPMILVYASGGSQTNYCDSFDRKYLGETTVIRELIPYIDRYYRTIAFMRRTLNSGNVDGRIWLYEAGAQIS